MTYQYENRYTNPLIFEHQHSCDSQSISNSILDKISSSTIIAYMYVVLPRRLWIFDD
jgi:hypothetical protein